MRWFIAVALAVLVAAGTANVHAQTAKVHAPKAVAASSSGVKPVASVLEIMKIMTIPFSTAVFDAAAEAPKDDASWDKVRSQAVALAEAGNLLMLGSRAKDRAAWMKFSRAQVDAAEAAAKAAAAKNADQLSMASDALYETCSDCHKVYMAK